MLVAALLSVIAQSEQVIIPPTAPNIRYVGRWDFRDPNGPRAQWSASTVEFKIKGKSLSVTFAGSPDYWVEELDGRPVTTLQFRAGVAQQLVNDPNGGTHTVRLVKATEAFVGIGQLVKVSLSPGDVLLALPKPKHKLEIIGDSISCGYGNLGKNEKEHFKPETENAYLAYGPIAARALHADVADIAWSGRKMWPDNTVPEIYDLTLPNDKTSTWTFGVAPDAIVINLATNDFGGGAPDEKGWTTAYSAFVDRLRTHAPKARIYFAIGTMMSDGWPPNAHALTTLHKYLNEIVGLRKAAGDRNVAILDMGVQDGAKDGLGSDYHPSVATHQKMAGQLVDTIKSDLHW